MSYDALLLFGLLYGIPLLRWASGCWRGLRTVERVHIVQRALGRLEWAISRVRDTVGLLGWGMIVLVTGLSWIRVVPVVISPGVLAMASLAIIVSLWCRRDHQRLRCALIAYLMRYPHIHPQALHDAYFAGFGPIATSIPTAAPRCLRGPLIDFRRGRPSRRRLWPLIHGAFSTCFYASLVLTAARDYSLRKERQRAVDCIAQLWGARLADLAHIAISIHGLERLRHVKGCVVVCSNHSSIFDFVVTPFALSFATMMRDPLHIRFLVAKDHFLDTWWYYRALRMGMAMQAAGMVFVNRTGASHERQQAVGEAVHQMVRQGLDVAVYPQGTRAPARRDEHGMRMESGYYTVGSQKRRQELGRHVKTGAARLAVTAARTYHAQGHTHHVTLIPVAVHGAGTLLPKGAWAIDTEGVITVTIGEPKIVVSTGDDDAADIAEYHAWMDHQLQRLTGVNHSLKDRLCRNLQQFAQGADIAAIMNRVDVAEGEVQLRIFATLDHIYQMPTKSQQAYLEAWSHLLLAGGDMHAFYTKVVQAI